MASGRSVRESPLRSGKVYISFPTISVSAPMERAKSSVRSEERQTDLAVAVEAEDLPGHRSTHCHRLVSGGNRSRMPRIALIMTVPCETCFKRENLTRGGHIVKAI